MITAYEDHSNGDERKKDLFDPKVDQFGGHCKNSKRSFDHISE